MNRSNNPIIDILVDAITASGKKFNEIDKRAIFSHLKKQGINQNKLIDYDDSSHNDVKLRQPRKSIFSEIKKIAG